MTAAHAATIPPQEIINWQKSTLKSGKTSGRMIRHPLLPYITPYHMWGPYLACEMIAPFAGPQWGLTSLPPHAETTAEELWQFSEELMKKGESTAHPLVVS
jgi:hypothetical protein